MAWCVCTIKKLLIIHYVNDCCYQKRYQQDCFFLNIFCPDMMRSPISEVMKVSLQDQENRQTLKTTPVTEVVNNNPPKSLFKPSTFASTEPSSMQSISSSVQHCGNTGSSNSPPEYADYVCNNLAFFISKQQSENFPGQDILPKQRYTMHSNHSSNMSLQPNSAAESNSEVSTTSLQIRPTIHLSTLEDLYHAQ